MNPRVLPASAWKVVRLLRDKAQLDEWILAGGTALALQLGHRVSVDLDFFAHREFDPQSLRQKLPAESIVEVTAMAANTLHARLDGVRVTFLRSEVPFLYPPIEYRGLRLADARDIAAMKVVAVAGRGSRKDFIDIDAYLSTGPTVDELLELVNRRYQGTAFNAMHLVRSLVYFEDAESEPMPRMLKNVEWADVRARIEGQVRRWAERLG